MPDQDFALIPYQNIIMDVALRSEPAATVARINEYAEIMHDIEVEHYRQKYGDDGKLLEEKKDGR